MKIEIRPDGEPNFYRLDAPDRWLAVVQVNGEFHHVEQERIMRSVAAFLETLPIPARPTV